MEENRREIRILFQGDSITDGNRYREKSQEWDLNHQMGHGYAFFINGELGSRFPEAGYRFFNRGISGNRIGDLYARIQEDILQLRPQVLSILIGVNDALHQIRDQTGASPAKFEKIYRLLLDEVLEENPETKLVLCEPFLLPVGAVAEQWDRWENQIRGLQEAAGRVAQDYGAVWVPLQETFRELCQVREPSYWIWDGIHPTVCGHGILAKRWMEEVGEILPDCAAVKNPL